MHFKIYSRKSVFTGKGDSIENQVELCRAYLQAHYPAVTDTDVTVYEDEGFSGKNLDRPQFQRLMGDLTRDAPACIVCYRLDRISRNVGDFAALIQQLERWGVGFLCIREQFDTTTPMGKAMLYIASVFAQLERETIAERVRDNMLLLARTGRWLGGQPPTGFLAEKRREVVVDGKLRTSCVLRENHAELPVVEAIYRAFLSQGSLSGVQRYLAEQGLSSRSEKNFSLPGIRDILQNPVYCAADAQAWDYFTNLGAEVCFHRDAAGLDLGLLAYNKRDYSRGNLPRNPVEKWVVALGQHRGVIPGERWVAVQERLAESSAPAHAHNRYALLSGLIRCGKCGGPLLAKARQGQISGQLPRFDYICQTKLRQGKKGCDCQNLCGFHTDQAVCTRLRDSLSPAGDWSDLLHQIQLKLDLRGAENTLPALERRMRDCRQEAAQLAALLGRSGSDGLLVETVTARMQELEWELTRLSQAKHQLIAPPGGEASLETPPLVRSLASPQGVFDSMTAAEKRAVLRSMLEDGAWDGTVLRLRIRKP